MATGGSPFLSPFFHMEDLLSRHSTLDENWKQAVLLLLEPVAISFISCLVGLWAVSVWAQAGLSLGSHWLQCCSGLSAGGASAEDGTAAWPYNCAAWLHCVLPPAHTTTGVHPAPQTHRRFPGNNLLRTEAGAHRGCPGRSRETASSASVPKSYKVARECLS